VSDATGRYAGIGRGRRSPAPELTEAVLRAFRTMELGVANELAELIDFLNADYASDAFNRAEFSEVQRLAATCTTGCRIVEPHSVSMGLTEDLFASRLVSYARAANRVPTPGRTLAGVPQ
jgi:hypothetical protein